MRMFTTAALSALLAIGGSAAAQELTIATFNAEFLTRPRVHMKFGLPFSLPEAARAEWDAPGFRDRKFAEAAQVVATLLTGIDADVLALTEVGDERDVRELAEAIRAQGVAYDHVAVCDCPQPAVNPSERDLGTYQYVAVLSKLPLHGVLRRIPGYKSYEPELDDHEEELETDVAKAMRVTFSAGGQDFHLYVAHLASERGGHEKDAMRIAQAAILRRHFLPLLSEGQHVIVAGDLNDHPGQPAIRRIRGLDDMGEDLLDTGHYRYFDRDKLDTRWTYQFRGRREQIDYVLLSRSIRDASVPDSIRASVPEVTDRRVSDHRPFVVRFQLK
jgi:endonuclease/exonuclease/phosphatase family metal-dependent hydrolase